MNNKSGFASVLLFKRHCTFSGVARVAEHPDGDDLADALPGPLGALHCHGQGRPGENREG